MNICKSIDAVIRKVVVILFVGLIFSNSLLAQVTKMTAFPGAEGFGRFATGGRGGDVYHVTNLDDNGAGSLRYGLDSANSPRTIVFDLSGTIWLKDKLYVTHPNITIAGQTAPGDGITLAGDEFGVKASDVIVRYIRCRLGDRSGRDDDAAHIHRGFNIIFDHVSVSWSIDETFSFQSGKIDSVTVQWCMITESLNNSHHIKGGHGYGGIIGGLRQSVHHNLYAHHSSRSPKVTKRRHCEVDFRNNVIYNWGHNNCYDGNKSYLNWANNYYKPGPGTKENVRHRIFALSNAMVKEENSGWQKSNTYPTLLYAEGNYVEGYPEITADNWAGGIDFSDGATEAKNRKRIPHEFPPITEQTAEEAYALVLAGAGASLVRDTIDERISREVLIGTAAHGNGGIIDSQDDVGGWPQLNSLPALKDTDQDGMPDQWEMQHNLDPDDPSDRNGDADNNGFTNLEEYLNSIVINKP
ncbi:pectate lyase family protein [Sunxiuqinia indica]|uniref:pectate lyase family protein n=1 Tax=Sunxiuqinia indica TaxID=2692584 RepID=UPI001F2146FB|nr:pectate lyase [Sunxiuqinia indica]